jgi:hypothetical protein
MLIENIGSLILTIVRLISSVSRSLKCRNETNKKKKTLLMFRCPTKKSKRTIKYTYTTQTRKEKSINFHFVYALFIWRPWLDDDYYNYYNIWWSCDRHVFTTNIYIYTHTIFHNKYKYTMIEREFVTIDLIWFDDERAIERTKEQTFYFYTSPLIKL